MSSSFFGLIGKKLGMSQYIAESGEVFGVTIVEVEDNTLGKVCNDTSTVELIAGKKKHLSKPVKGQLKKASAESMEVIKGFKLSKEALEQVKTGDKLSVDILNDVSLINVRGLTKGKGFTGVQVRHNFSSQRASHGNSKAHNAPGSIGQNQTPGRVFPGKKMAGQYGNEYITTENLTIIKIDPENKLVVIKGSIPGPSGNSLILYPSKRKTG